MSGASSTEAEGRLAGKVAFVTGGGSGIGRASCLRFAREGASVVVAERDSASGAATEEAVRDQGGEAIFVETDVTVEESVRAAVGTSVSRYERLDVLFNCAGGSVADDAPVTTVDIERVWSHTLSLDLLGPLLCARHCVPELVRSGGGSIINTSSAAALRGSTGPHVYAAAKGGVISFTRALAATYARDGIRANVICPSLVLSERIRGRFGASEAGAETIDDSALRARYANHPFAIGRPEDIAAVALFLASDESRMLTGSVIAADGGLSAY